MNGTVAVVGLAIAVIEITGIPGIVALLAPFAILVIVILRLRRPLEPSQTSTQTTDMLRVIPPNEMLPVADVAPEVLGVSAPAIDWAARISAAEEANDVAALAGLYLSCAKDEIANGRKQTAAEHLRSSVRLAAKTRNAAVQAEARLELAELSREAGDLTTACEHWQIARSLFRGLARKPELDETERLMQQHGCPTDWVLNDF